MITPPTYQQLAAAWMEQRNSSNDQPFFAGMVHDIASGKLVIVPAEPTEAMLDAGADNLPHSLWTDRGRAKDLYRAMLAAAQEQVT